MRSLVILGMSPDLTRELSLKQYIRPLSSTRDIPEISSLGMVQGHQLPFSAGLSLSTKSYRFIEGLSVFGYYRKPQEVESYDKSILFNSRKSKMEISKQTMREKSC